MLHKAGFHGLGNTRFKSSVNRAPRQTTEGSEGEVRNIKLEMKVLADVGMLGLPNAGKSTFIRAVSAAQPKVADYPFTTLIPSLGVVKVQPHRSFVVADIPGLIEGASEGAGMGVRFLKHLTRCRVLIHLVDLNPIDGSSPLENARAIFAELARFSPMLALRECWLVFNKADTLTERDATKRANDILTELDWQGKSAIISALAGNGTESLCAELLNYLEGVWQQERENEDAATAERKIQEQMQAEARNKIDALRASRKAQVDDDDEDDDDYDVEVEYVR